MPAPKKKPTIHTSPEATSTVMSVEPSLKPENFLLSIYEQSLLAPHEP